MRSCGCEGRRGVEESRSCRRSARREAPLSQSCDWPAHKLQATGQESLRPAALRSCNSWRRGFAHSCRQGRAGQGRASWTDLRYEEGVPVPLELHATLHVGLVGDDADAIQTPGVSTATARSNESVRQMERGERERGWSDHVETREREASRKAMNQQRKAVKEQRKAVNQ